MTGSQGPQGPAGTPVLTGVGAPSCAIGNDGDLYIDISTGNLYYKEQEPVPPANRPVPSFTGNTLNVGSTRLYTTIQAALTAAVNGDRLLLDAETFTITATLPVNKSVTIEGQGKGLTTVITTSNAVTTMFNVTVSNVIFREMTLVQNFPSIASTETIIRVGNFATGIYVDNCELSVCEFGITLIATEFQITNCDFTYAPAAALNNNYRYISIASTSGQSIIDSNTFVSGSGNSNCSFIIITNIAVSSGTLKGDLVVRNNEQVVAFQLRHLLNMEETIGNNFGLYIINNRTFSEGNVPVLLNGPNLNIFKFIAVYGNAVQNTAGKGIVGIDLNYLGSTDIFETGNSITNPTFAVGWASATTDPTSVVVGYHAAVIPVPPNLPLNPCYWLLLSEFI
ncbi:cell surface glycoprotein [Rossellomorea marisflavi]|uniref:cell surface glycoprotein n=1 Tax=Rossellomorea marisflavi TaxID=189381 RepID=UPI0034591FF9